MKLLFVGQAPSKETDGQPPFIGKCGKFLAELLGTTQEQMLQEHDFINILDNWPGKGITGDKFPMQEAKIAARKKLSIMEGRTCVLLGRNVATALGCKQFQYFWWYEIHDPVDFDICVVKQAIIIPHPSGVNRHWNKEENRLIATKFLRMLASIKE